MHKNCKRMKKKGSLGMERPTLRSRRRGSKDNGSSTLSVGVDTWNYFGV